MTSANNVFSGPNAVADFFDPDRNPPLPLVEIPDRLNPYRKDGVRIYAKMLTHLPAQNVKSLPALSMLRGLPEAKDKAIVEASSGSTVLSLGIIARVLWGHNDVNAYVTNKKHPDSLKLLRFFGITPHLYGGLAQQEPTDESGIMCRLRRLAAKRDDTIYPGQYDNDNNWKAHEQWTGPQIMRQLPQINIFVTTVGTGGCITGTSLYLKSAKPSCMTLGVFNAFGDATPGPRHLEGFHSCGFPWRENIDAYVNVPSVESFRMSMHLSREGLIAGPSSGQALKGLLDYLGQLKEQPGDKFKSLLAESGGEISCVFTCNDLPYQYLPQYFDKLGEDEFPQIQNKILLQCDQLRHDERWILDASTASGMMMQRQPTTPNLKTEIAVSSTSLDSIDGPTGKQRSSEKPSRTSSWSILRSCFGGVSSRQRRTTPPPPPPPPQSPVLRYYCCAEHPATAKDNKPPVIIDLRSSKDFKSQHFPGSTNLPLRDLTPDLAGNDLFGDAETVHKMWNNLQSLFSTANAQSLLEDTKTNKRAVIVLCYDGDVSRLGSAILRDKGIEACTVKGGFGALWRVVRQ